MVDVLYCQHSWILTDNLSSQKKKSSVSVVDRLHFYCCLLTFTLFKCIFWHVYADLYNFCTVLLLLLWVHCSVYPKRTTSWRQVQSVFFIEMAKSSWILNPDDCELSLILTLFAVASHSSKTTVLFSVIIFSLVWPWPFTTPTLTQLICQK